jgi:predicted phage-related endonuclease
VTRAAWLESRRRGLGGSDVGQIPSIVRACGGDPAVDCSPWGSEWHVWASKTEQGPPSEQAESAEMAIGNWLEPVIIEWAAEALGGEPVDSPATFECGVLAGSPDGWVQRASPGLLEGLEAKVSADWQPWEAPPFYYLLQCRTYLICSDAPRWHLAAYFRQANVRRIYTIERDPEAERLLSEAAAAWWQRHIVEGHHPEVDASADCARGLAHLHPRTAGASFADFRIATDDEIQLCAGIARAESVRDELDSDIREQRNRLRRIIGDAPGLRWTGGSVRWSRNNLKITIKE